MVSVQKRIGRTEAYMESKIIAGCRKAGATAEDAAKVVNEVGVKVQKMTVVEAEKLSDMVVGSLRKVNKGAADAFLIFRREKYERQPRTKAKGQQGRD